MLSLKEQLEKDLRGCESILELGCGKHSLILDLGLGKKTTAIDIFQPYISEHIRNNDYNHCFCGNIENLSVYPKFDAVVAVDVLEHLNKKETLQRIEQWGKKVIIFVPNGWVDNPVSDGNVNQEHHLAWDLEDFAGYHVKGLIGLKSLYVAQAVAKYQPRRLWTLAGIASRVIVYNKPQLAYALYAVREYGS